MMNILHCEQCGRSTHGNAPTVSVNLLGSRSCETCHHLSPINAMAYLCSVPCFRAWLIDKPGRIDALAAYITGYPHVPYPTAPYIPDPQPWHAQITSAVPEWPRA